MARMQSAWGGWKTRITRQGWLCQALGKLERLTEWLGSRPVTSRLSPRQPALGVERFEERLTPAVAGMISVDAVRLDSANADLTWGTDFSVSPHEQANQYQATSGAMSAQGLPGDDGAAQWRLGGAEIVHASTGLVVASQLDSGRVGSLNSSGGEIVFVSADLVGKVPMVWGRGAEVVVLDPTRDSIRQMTETLLGRTGLSAIHVVSHGSAGALWLGSQKLDAAVLEARSLEIRGWSEALAPGADLLLYGCDVASTSQGRLFVDELGQFTGADVAASTNTTGSGVQGGDTVLEYATGQIQEGVLGSQADWNKSGVTLPRYFANPGFESGDISGWELTNGTDPEGLTVTDSITIKDVTYTAPDGGYFFAAEAGAVDVFQGVQQSQFLEAGTVVRGWAFFSTEDYLPFNDEALVTISSPTTILFSKNVENVGNGGSTDWVPFSYTVPTSDWYTITAGVRNSQDNANPSYIGLDLETNKAPLLPDTAILAGGVEDQAFEFTYADLVNATNLSDPNGDPVSFTIESVTTGTLTKNGTAVTPGTTVLAPGESLVWTPAANVNGSLNAFTVTATDGILTSTATTQVRVVVTPVNDAPVAVSSGVETYWFPYTGDMSSAAYVDSNAEKVGNRPDFFIDDNILSSEVGRSDLVFVRMYAYLAIPAGDGSGSYPLYLRTLSDDGVQVWVNRGSGYESVISNRSDHGPTFDSSDLITVGANRLLPVKVEWWENGGGAVLDLEWSTDNQNWSRIPDTSIGKIAFTPIEEDSASSGQTVAEVFGGAFTDLTDEVAGGSSANQLAGVAILANAATASQGVWQYQSNGTWADIPTSLTATASLSVAAGDRIRFLPAQDFNGAPGKLSVVLIDSSTTVTTGATVDVGDRGGSTPFSSNALDIGIAVTAVNDSPVFDAGSDFTGTIVEGSKLQTTGVIHFTDVDTQDRPFAKVTESSVTSTVALNASQLAAFLGGFSLTADSGNTNIGKLAWSYALSEGDLNFLADGETVEAKFTIQVSDENGGLVDRAVTITLSGANDTPLITKDEGDSDAADLEETDSGLKATGTLTVADLDVSNTVSVSVHAVATSGMTSGLSSDNASLLAMVTVPSGNVIGNTTTTGVFEWKFDSGLEAFNYLSAGKV